VVLVAFRHVALEGTQGLGRVLQRRRYSQRGSLCVFAQRCSEHTRHDAHIATLRPCVRYDSHTAGTPSRARSGGATPTTATISWTPRARSEVATVLAGGPVLDTILAWASLARCTKAILSPVPSAFSQSASLAAGVPLVGCCAGLDASGRVVSTKEAPPAAEVVAARGEVSAVSAARLPSSTTDGPRGLGSAAPGHLAARHAAASAQRRRRQCEGVGALRNGERCAKRKPAAGGSPLGGVSPQARDLARAPVRRRLASLLTTRQAGSAADPGHTAPATLAGGGPEAVAGPDTPVGPNASYSPEGQHILNDMTWLDEAGAPIEAHGAGMLQHNGRYYWFGEEKKRTFVRRFVETVACYSASSLAGPWRNHGRVLAQEEIRHPKPRPQPNRPTKQPRFGGWVVQRPKVLYNRQTRKFVMWFHLDLPRGTVERHDGTYYQNAQSLCDKAGAPCAKLMGYQLRSVGVATADRPEGPYVWERGFRPDGQGSLDLNLFQDPTDGQAYLIRDCSHKLLAISRLTPDYLGTAGIIATLPQCLERTVKHGRPALKNRCEGMAMFRHSGYFYLFTSLATGWWPNAVTLWRTAGKSLDNATWLNLGNPTGSRTSFNSQPTYVVQATTARGEPYFVYLGDNWMLCPSRDSAGPALEGACYIWLPFRMRAGESELEVDYRWRWRPSDPFAPVPRDPNPICRGQGNGEACGAEQKKRKRRPKRKEHTRWVSSRRAASQQTIRTLNATPGGTLTSGGSWKGATVG